MRKTEDQDIGGVLEIPDGWFLSGADFDSEIPTIEISSMDHTDSKTLAVPRSMAYFLSRHFCGSKEMAELLREDGRREVRNVIRGALGIKH